MAKDLTGTTLGKYQVMERLGRGGMADVYRAYQPGMDRYVAIKVMHAHLADDPSFLTRFQREAQRVGSLRHPHIVQVIDFDAQEGEYYMVMEYIQGDTLKAMLKQRGALPVGEALDIAVKLADAVAYAHSQGMIHRDIKPANVLMTKPDYPILTDFGIAHLMDVTGLTASGMAIGTPAYISPEVGRGEKVDERADIYSLGILLYEMLTGAVPYDADTPYAVILKHINDPLPMPRQFVETLPESVERIVLKALAKKREDRFQTAAEFRDALQQARDNLQAEAPTRSAKGAAQTPAAKPTVERTAIETVQRPARSSVPLIVGVLVVVVVIVLGGAVLLSGRTSASPTATVGVAQVAILPATQTSIPTTAPAAAPTTVSTTAPATAQAIGIATVAGEGSKSYADLVQRVRQMIVDGSSGSAFDLVDTALKADPNSYDLRTLHGRAAIAVGEADSLEKAKADADAAIKIDPNRPEAYLVLGGYWLYAPAEGDAHAANLRKSVDYFSKAIDIGTKYYEAYWGRANASIDLNGYVGGDNAIPIANIAKDWETGASLSPIDWRFYMDRGRFYFYTDQYPQAQQSFEQVLAMHPEIADTHPFLGVIYLQQGHPEKAFALYENQIVKKNNHDPRYLADGAYVAWANSQKDLTKDWAELSLAVEPNTPAATYALALLDWDAKKYDDALKKLDGLAKISDRSTFMYPYLNRLFDRDVDADRGRLLALMGRIDEAISAYEDAKKTDDSWLKLWIEQAQLYRQQGKIDEARQDLRRALDLAVEQKNDKARDEVIALLKQLGIESPEAPATPG